MVQLRHMDDNMMVTTKEPHIDVTETAKKAGLSYTTEVTLAVWEKCVQQPLAAGRETLDDLLWHICWNLKVAMMVQGGDKAVLFYDVLTPPVALKAIGAPDLTRPGVTIALADEHVLHS